MQIFIRTLIGKIITINVESSYTIEDIKKIVEKREGLVVKKQIFIWNGIFLDNKKSLSDYSINDSEVIKLVIKF